MKKFFLALGVAAMTLSASATTKILYSQNFETAADVAETGWSIAGGTISLASDDFGKFIELALGQNNGRTGFVQWGQQIYLNEDGTSKLEDGTYHVGFDFCIKTPSNNQYNGAITLFTSNNGVASQPWRERWTKPGNFQNWVFDMTQNNAAKEPLGYAVCAPTKVTETTADDGTVSYSYAVDMATSQTFEQGMWYVVSCDVNTITREVEYQVSTIVGNVVASGTRTVPETDDNGDPISMYTEGLWIMLARYQTTIDVDNIVVSYESAFDFANDPTIALTRLGKNAEEELDLRLRAYTITFMDGETLHVTGTDGSTIEVEYADCDGAYVYETSTSGVLKAWTTCGNATSNVVETTVECVPIALPAAEATISAVGEGYAKTYTLTVSNAEVPLRPTVFISYEFTGKNGETVVGNDEASGCKVTVHEEGTLKVTTSSYGYSATTTSIDNDLQFETKKAYDFARLDKEAITAAIGGEWYVLNSGATSGFNNWTARKRLYYNLAGSETVNDEGNTVYTTVYPFGFLSEDNETAVINYCVLNRDAIDATASGDYFEGLTIFPDKGKKEAGLPNVGIMEHIGLYNDETKNNNNNVIVNNLDQNDFVVVNYINNYGGNSTHPVCATDEEYYAQLEGESAVISVATDGVLNEETGLYDATYALYRIDTCITKITVFKQAGAPSAVEGIATEVAAPADNYYYSIDGIRMENPTKKGIYIHNGKKVVIK